MNTPFDMTQIAHTGGRCMPIFQNNGNWDGRAFQPERGGGGLPLESLWVPYSFIFYWVTPASQFFPEHHSPHSPLIPPPPPLPSRQAFSSVYLQMSPIFTPKGSNKKQAEQKGKYFRFPLWCIISCDNGISPHLLLKRDKVV